MEGGTPARGSALGQYGRGCGGNQWALLRQQVRLVEVEGEEEVVEEQQQQQQVQQVQQSQQQEQLQVEAQEQ